METELQQHEQFQNHVKQAMEQMTPEDRDEFVKSAKFHQSEVESLETNFEKSAYGQGAMDAAAMQQGGGLPEIPEEGSDMTIEEIVMILDQLVQSGEIEPQLADAVLQAVMAEMGGALGGAPGGAPMDPAALAAGGAPMDPAALAAGAAGAGMEEMPKAASTDSIIDAVTNEKKED
jgi:polyhydroxyalkanoate synthesis regulator phasin